MDGNLRIYHYYNVKNDTFQGKKNNFHYLNYIKFLFLEKINNNWNFRFLNYLRRVLVTAVF